MNEEDGQGVSATLFFGAVLASIGGPLALVAFYVPGAAGDALSSSGLTIALALVVFLMPLAVWLGFSERIASAGGLTAFVEAASGSTLARVQALVWIVSYFLYLPYTVTYIVYDLLAPVFPGLVAYRAALEIVMPVAICLLALTPLAASLSLLTLAAAGQLALVIVLGSLSFAHAGGTGNAFSPHASGSVPIARGVAGVALLFVCASLPIFFGAEVRGGTTTVRRGLGAGYATVAVFLLFAAIPLATLAPSLTGAGLPGVAIAQAYSGRPLAVAVAVGGAVSVAGLIVLELLALGRLLHWLVHVPVRAALAAVAVPFIVADIASLSDPQSFYNDLIRPSLIALFASQLFVFVVYPLYRRRTRPDRLLAAVAAAGIATALFGYGLYTAIANTAGT